MELMVSFGNLLGLRTPRLTVAVPGRLTLRASVRHTAFSGSSTASVAYATE
jgi:hypothetical protein